MHIQANYHIGADICLITLNGSLTVLAKVPVGTPISSYTNHVRVSMSQS